ncbi:MAG: AbrB/MazE/SpoVT family DNA-binding domain-containing protein [Defluviitaleaceae bacterium]|nr:AbrB/MazE/SpoVT family DNA-binding domain-containing protein [Defluviitaleaceae bacterium]
MTTAIVKWGNSRGIRIPKPFLENLGLKENDTVDILTENNRIIIQKSSNVPHKTTRQRFEDFYGKDFESILKEHPYGFEESDTGEPVGREIW